MQNKELKARTNDEQRTAADNSTSASLVQNGLLAEAKLRPILFSTPMVTAILEGRKTKTRRIVKMKDGSLMQEEDLSNHLDGSFDKVMDFTKTYPYWQELKCPYGETGDILWVREKWRHNDTPTGFPYHYYEDDTIYTDRDNEKWKPSIFMPKVACRIFLEITHVKVERLHDIDEEDIYSEGITNKKFPFKEWQRLWQKINGAESWDENPFVWVISFELTERPPGFC